MKLISCQNAEFENDTTEGRCFTSARSRFQMSHQKPTIFSDDSCEITQPLQSDVYILPASTTSHLRLDFSIFFFIVPSTIQRQ